MQQYYGLDVTWVIFGERGGGARGLWRVSALLSQLPEGARLRVAEHPDESWTAEAQMLRLIEYELRTWVMAHAKDAPDQEPLPLPHECIERQEMADRAERDMADVAAALGLIGGDGDAS